MVPAIPKLEITGPDEIFTGNQAMGLLCSALKRLQDPDVTVAEAKKLRLLIQGTKSYMHLYADYLLRMRRMESQMLSQFKHMAAMLQMNLDSEQDPEKKADIEQRIKAIQEEIKDAIDTGVRELKEEEKGYLTK